MSRFARLEVFHPLLKFERPGLMANTREIADQFLSSPSGSIINIRTSEWETYESREVNFDPQPTKALRYYQFTKIVNNIDSAGVALYKAKSDALHAIAERAASGGEGFSEGWTQCVHFDELEIVASAINPKSSFLVMRSTELSGSTPPFYDFSEQALVALTSVNEIVGGKIDESLASQIPPVEGVLDDALVGGVKLGSIASSVTNEPVISDFIDNLKKNILPARIAIGPVAIELHS